MPYTPWLVMYSWLTSWAQLAPACCSSPGKTGPASAYAMNSSAIAGSGQPIARRVASSSAITSTLPIATSSADGLPTRNAMSSKIHGM